MFKENWKVLLIKTIEILEPLVSVIINMDVGRLSLIYFSTASF